MKKITALLLCVLMILSMAAFAEGADDTALISRISNIAIEANVEGESVSKKLDDFEIYLSLDTADGLALVGQAFNGDDQLALAMAKLEGQQIKVAIDGMDKAYVADIPQLEGQDLSGIAESVRQAFPRIISYKLPMIPAISLPKLDVMPFLSMLGTSNPDGSLSFSVPSELVDTLLDQLLQTANSSAEAVPEMAQASFQQILGLVEQLRASGMSFSLEGTAVDALDKQTISISLFLVSQGQTSEAPVAILTLTSMQDQFDLALDVPVDGGNMTVGSLTVTTADGALQGVLDIAGMMQMTLNVFQEGTIQCVVLSLGGSAMEGGTFAIELDYGESDGNDLIKLVVNGMDQFNVEASCTSKMTSEVSDEGAFSLYFDAQGSAVALTADIEDFIGSLNLGDFAIPAATAPIEELESEEGQAAVQTALAPLLEYFNAAFADEAA